MLLEVTLRYVHLNKKNYKNQFKLSFKVKSRLSFSKQIQMLIKTLDASYFHLNISNEFSLSHNFYPKMITTLYFDNPPFSELNVGHGITGVEGNLIDEFCLRHRYDYRIVGVDFGRLLDAAIDMKYDFSLYRPLTGTESTSVDILRLNDLGAAQCILVPRNIPVCVPFSSPYSRIVNILFLVSVAVVLLVWNVFRRIHKQKLGVLNSTIEVLKVLLGLGISDNHWLRSSFKEKVLLVPFLFMTFILMEIYESFMVSNIISEQAMDSVKSVEELISSDTKIFEYHNETYRFRADKVVNLVQFVNTRLATIPKDFNPNYAYFVRCRFGEEFINSEENYVGTRKLFDLIPDTFMIQLYSTYLVNENTPIKNQFKFMVKALDEAGIIDHWTKDVVRNTFNKYEANEELQIISLRQVLVPLLVVAFGSIASFFAFGLEVFYAKICGRRSNKVGDIELEMIRIGKAKTLVIRRRRHSI